MERIHQFSGGRKMFAQYPAAALLTGMAAWLRPPFREYALAVRASLGLTGAVAYEDARRREGRRFGIGLYRGCVHLDTRGTLGHHAPARWETPEPWSS